MTVDTAGSRSASRLGIDARVVPTLRPGRRFLRLVERNATVARRSWFVLVVGLLEPFFYLGSIGIGVGGLVGDVVADGRTIPYETFVAPGLLATAAMNGVIFETTFNFFIKLKYGQIYDAALATTARTP